MNNFREELRAFLDAKEAELPTVYATAVERDYPHDEVARVLVYTIENNVMSESTYMVKRRPDENGMAVFNFKKLI